jgi:hypothetical protein
MLSTATLAGLYSAKEETVMRNTAIALVAVLAIATSALAAPPGQAEHNRYKWKDTQGNLHFDDVLPEEAMMVGYDIVNSYGIIVRHVERVRTPEERKADEEEAARKAAEKRIVDEQIKADQQTLAAYPTENELIETQNAQIAMIEQNSHATEISLQNQEKSLSEVLSHAADLDRTGKPVPEALKRQIETLRKNIEQQKNYIAAKGKEKIEAAKKSEAELARYRDLRAKAKSH